MVFTILDDLIFYQILTISKRFSNFELKLYNFFLKKTKIYPKCIIVIDQFVFFFIDSNLKVYSEVKKHIHYLRRNMVKKVAIIKDQSTLIHLIYSLFPDIFIYDIAIEDSNIPNEKKISLFFLSYQDRAIAIGRKGNYIKAINQLLKNYILFQNHKSQVKLECKVVNQNKIFQNSN